MIFNFNQTFDRIVATKKIIYKGHLIERSMTFPATEMISNIGYWGRDSIGPITIDIDGATIRPLREDEVKDSSNDNFG